MMRINQLIPIPKKLILFSISFKIKWKTYLSTRTLSSSSNNNNNTINVLLLRIPQTYIVPRRPLKWTMWPPHAQCPIWTITMLRHPRTSTSPILTPLLASITMLTIIWTLGRLLMAIIKLIMRPCTPILTPCPDNCGTGRRWITKCRPAIVPTITGTISEGNFGQAHYIL